MNLHLYAVLLSACAAITHAMQVFAPQQNAEYNTSSKIDAKYQISNALSSGTRNMYVYVEPGHKLVHKSSYPYTSMEVSFTFRAPSAKGPFALVFYDEQTAGVLQFPFVNVENVALTAV
ncbi:hypothetical protein HDU81_004345 [Chytriomyces hyalinus]|nr:hypothetical protein HDU81_004345 [Chytriomyces hyalinus]